MRYRRLEHSISRIITLIQHTKKGKPIPSIDIAWGKGENNRTKLKVEKDGMLILNDSRIGNVSEINRHHLHHDSEISKLLIKGLLTEKSEYWNVFARLIKVMEDGKGDANKLERLIKNLVELYPHEINRLIYFLHTQNRTNEAIDLAKTKLRECVYSDDSFSWRKINDCLLDIFGSDKYEEIIDEVFQKPEVLEKYNERVKKYFGLIN